MRFVPALAVGVVSAAVLACLDRLIKLILVAHPAVGGVILHNWLYLRIATNPALALGIPFPARGVTILTAIVLPLLVWWWLALLRRRDGLAVVAAAWIIFGASSNLLDRLRWGYVVDYLDVPWFTVFNLADAMITMGVVLLIGREVAGWRRPRSREQGAGSRGYDGVP